MGVKVLSELRNEVFNHKKIRLDATSLVLLNCHAQTHDSAVAFSRDT